MARFALEFMAIGVFWVPYYLIMDHVYGVPWWASFGLGVLVVAGHDAGEWARKWIRRD